MRDRITRHILHPDFILKTDITSDQAWTLGDIHDGIDRKKRHLASLGLKRGDRIILAVLNWPDYLFYFLAGAEMGIGFLVTDSPLFSPHPFYRIGLYGRVDRIIAESPHTEFYETHFPGIVTDVSSDQEDGPSHSAIDCQPDDALIYTTSSGTTDTPKVIVHSHRFFFDLLHRNARIMDLRTEDSCLHTRILHHGSVCGVFFLPSLAYCSRHYANQYMKCPRDNANGWLGMIAGRYVNRALLFHGMAEELIEQFQKIQPLPDLSGTDFYMLTAITTEHVDVLVGKHNAKLFSIFGCSETSGPLFMPSYDMTNAVISMDYGAPLDDFYRLRLDADNHLIVTMPDGAEMNTGDVFRVEDGRWIFEGRDGFYRLADERKIQIRFLIHQLSKALGQVGKDYDVCVDSEKSAIYLRTDNEVNLTHINEMVASALGKDYHIDMSVVMTREDLIRGIKFDNELLRVICREMSGWSGRRESNPCRRFGRPELYP